MSDREELTPDDLIEEGKKLEKFVLAHTSIEERLAGVSPQEVLKNYSPKDIQRYLDTLKNK